VTNVSTATLLELYQLLKDSSDRSHVVEIQKELVTRARAQGLTTRDILAALVAGVGKKADRVAIASAWCEALGLTDREARRRAR
jgi:hypothetical protein